MKNSAGTDFCYKLKNELWLTERLVNLLSEAKKRFMVFQQNREKLSSSRLRSVFFGISMILNLKVKLGEGNGARG